jgi:hypothetical protein
VPLSVVAVPRLGDIIQSYHRQCKKNIKAICISLLEWELVGPWPILDMISYIAMCILASQDTLCGETNEGYSDLWSLENLCAQ